MTEVIFANEFHQRTVWPRTQAEMICEDEPCIWICPEPYGDRRRATRCAIWFKDDGRDIGTDIKIIDFGCGLSQELAIEIVRSIACRLGINRILIDLAKIKPGLSRGATGAAGGHEA